MKILILLLGFTVIIVKPLKAFQFEDSTKTFIVGDEYGMFVKSIIDTLTEKYPTEFTNDTIFVKIHKSISQFVPSYYKNKTIRIIDEESPKGLNNTKSIVLDIYPMFYNGEYFIVKFQITKLIYENGYTMVNCCEGCSAGGAYYFKLNREQKMVIKKVFYSFC